MLVIITSMSILLKIKGIECFVFMIEPGRLYFADSNRLFLNKFFFKDDPKGIVLLQMMKIDGSCVNL